MLEIAMAEKWLKTNLKILSPTEVVPTSDSFPHTSHIVAMDNHFMPAHKKGKRPTPLLGREDLRDISPPLAPRKSAPLPKVDPEGFQKMGPRKEINTRASDPSA